jgi:hypothetical protein
VYRSDHAPVEQLMVNRAHSSPDVQEDGTAGVSLVECEAQCVDEEPRCLVRPAALEAS